MIIERIEALPLYKYDPIESFKISFYGEIYLDGYNKFDMVTFSVSFWHDREWAEVDLITNSDTYKTITTSENLPRYWRAVDEAIVLACAAICNHNNYMFDEQLWFECVKRIAPKDAIIDAPTVKRLLLLSDLCTY